MNQVQRIIPIVHELKSDWASINRSDRWFIGSGVMAVYLVGPVVALLHGMPTSILGKFVMLWALVFVVSSLLGIVEYQHLKASEEDEI